jgi:Aldehyde dehydrogenase family
MTDHSNDTPEVNLVAIDVAKQWNVVLVKDCSGSKRSFKVANTAADHEKLIRFLMALYGQVRIALEPTGDYHRPLAFRPLQAVKTATSGDTIRTITTHYIDGSFVESHGSQVMDVIKPTNGQVIARVTLGDEEDTRHAIAAAKRAFSTFGRTTKEERKKSYAACMRPLPRESAT